LILTAADGNGNIRLFVSTAHQPKFLWEWKGRLFVLPKVYSNYWTAVYR